MEAIRSIIVVWVIASELNLAPVRYRLADYYDLLWEKLNYVTIGHSISMP